MSSLLRVIFDPDTIPPTVPAISSVVAVGQNRLDITWSASTDTGGSGLAGYDLLKDGGTVITLGNQLIYSDTGLVASSNHTYRVRARDTAGNASAYSTQASGTTAAAPSAYNPDYPRFGSYAVGGTQNASNAALAECHVNILPYGCTWPQRKGVTLEAKASGVKALSTIATKLFPYVIHVDALDSWAATNNDFYEWYTILTTNQWFVYTNGITHTGKVVGSATGWSKPNYATTCPLVSGDTAFTWKAKWDYRLLFSGGTFFNGVTNVTVGGTTSLDGKYDDNIFARERSAGDYDVDGVSESVSSAANINLIQSSHAANLAYWNTLAPAGTLTLANCADWPIWYPGGVTGLPIDQLYDGGVMENIDEWINGTRGTTASALFGAIKVCQDAFKASKLGILEVQVSALTAYAELRYWHCIAALTGTYLYQHVSSGYLAEELGTVNYDERRFILGPAMTDSTGAVQWTPKYQSGANGTGIYRRDFANGIVLWAAPGATYSAQALGGTFFRLVGALDGATNNGQSLSSITMTAGTGLVLARTSQDATAPSVPGSLSASAASSSQINLVWNASTDTGGSGLAGYKIERSPDGTSGWTQIQQQAGTTYSDSGLSASTQYFYRVRAYDTAGNNSGYSTTANATTSASTGGLAFPLASTNRVAAVAPMYPVFPRPDSETAAYAGHKKAYFDGVNQIEYRYPILIQSGAPPFRFTLQQGPPGMTIGRYWGDPNYGEIVWTPTANVTNATVSVLAEDQDNTTPLTFTWTVSTSSSPNDFVFVRLAAEGGSDSNPGTYTQPFATPAKLLNSSAYAGRRAMFFPGTYDVPTQGQIVPSQHPMSWVAFAGGHTVKFRCSTGRSSPAFGTDTGCNDFLWNGIDLDNSGCSTANYRTFWMGGVSHRATIIRCDILNPYNGSTGGDVTTGWFFDSPGTGVFRDHIGFYRCNESGRIDVGNNAYSLFATYVCRHGVAEWCTVTSTATFDMYVKASNNLWTFRYCTVAHGASGNGTGTGTGCQTDAGLANGNFEYWYCSIDAPQFQDTGGNVGGALTLNYNGSTGAGRHDVIRCSIKGAIWIRGSDSAGPYRVVNCAIQANAPQVTTRFNGNGTQVTVVGTECHGTSGILDGNMLLTGTFRTNYLGKRGREIA